MPENDKVFVGMTRYKEFDWGKVTELGFTETDLDTMKSYLNERGFVNLVIKESRGGKPYTEINTYGLDVKKEAPVARPKDDDLPF